VPNPNGDVRGGRRAASSGLHLPIVCKVTAGHMGSKTPETPEMEVELPLMDSIRQSYASLPRRVGSYARFEYDVLVRTCKVTAPVHLAVS
jgi:hypothetical protein